VKLARDAPIDLQLHTVYSDGVWTPEQLIDYLLREGFGTAAITDHDRVDTIDSLQQHARDRGFPLLTAAEMSAHWRGEPVDVLVYGFDVQANALRSVADNLLHQQQDNIWQTVTAIGKLGYRLPDEAVRKLVEQPAVQQPHSLVKLFREAGYSSPERSAGRLLLDAGLQIVTTDVGMVVDAAH
jgi:3',5'-nucleoside bisphosphate phosphatase